MRYPLLATVNAFIAVVLVVGAVQAPLPTAVTLGALALALAYASLRLAGWRPNRHSR